MIYGKTHEQYRKERHIKWAKQAEWRRWFAWYPVSLPDGRRVWLQCIEKRIIWFSYRILKFSGHWKTEYRRIKHN